MKRYIALFLIATASFAIVSPVWAVTATELMQQSRLLSAEQRYGEAREKLDQALKLEPKNDDIRLLQAYLDYHEGNYDAAEKEFAGILERHPDYADAREGLERVQAARKSSEGLRWQADIGYELSSFERVDQPDWHDQTLQLTRFFDGKATAVHGRIERYDRFFNIDTYYQLGIDHRFTPRLVGYMASGVSPGGDFRPQFRIKTGGAARLNELETQNWPLWLTLDMQHDEYKAAEVDNFNLGLRLEFTDYWAVSGKMIAVHEHGTQALYGWMARLDGEITPGTRFLVGYADAPETEAGVTVDTKTIFGGLAYDVDEALTIHLGYTYDDRENSYIRHAVNANVSFRF